MKRPLGVSIISYFYIFGAIILLITAVFYNADADSIGINDRFGIQIVPERFMRLLLAIFSLGMAYGYMKLRMWGFWIMITYSALFGIISSLLLSNHLQQPFLGNMIFSIIVLFYTIYVRNAFLKTNLQD